VIVEMPADEAWFLDTLPDRLRSFLSNPETNRRLADRLFPIAYRDPDEQAKYRRMLGRDLARRKLECVDGFAKTLERSEASEDSVSLHLTGEEYEFWLGFLNDFRLMLGVELGITEDDWGHIPDDDRASDFIILHYLTHLQDELLHGSGYDLPRLDPDEI
jgi:hypothetical protein